MIQIPIKKILRELGKLEEYNYPIGDYSLFILPDGRMVGTSGNFKHQLIFEKILKCKITDNQEFINILIAINCIKVITNNFSCLYVDIVTPVTVEQKHTLEGLGMYSKYINIIVDNLREYAPDGPSRNYCRRLLKLPFD